VPSKHGNELLGSIKGGEFLDQLRNHQVLKNDCSVKLCRWVVMDTHKEECLWKDEGEWRMLCYKTTLLVKTS
jgi:hypothetical protein